MPATPEMKKETTRSLDNIRSLFNGETSHDDEKIKRYESLVDKIVKIPIDDIELDENIRASINTEDESFKSLLHSIRKHGIQQNIVVEFRKLPSGFKIACVCGHRRVMAARMTGNILVVPAIIKQFEKGDTRVELALAENLLREGLHCLDIANGYQKLFELHWTKEKLMETFGKTHRTITTYLKMASWPESAKKIIRDNPTFTTRLLVHQIACRKFASHDDLIATLNSFISSDKMDQKKVPKKEANKHRLAEYLRTKEYSNTIKEAIEQAFRDFKYLA